MKDIADGVPGIKIMLPDGFTPFSAVIQNAGAEAQGAFVSVAGLPNSELKGAGQAFVQGFGKVVGKTPDPYSVYAAQAAEILVAAIAQSNGTRADIAKQIFKVQIKNGILGTFAFNSNGDVTANPVTIYRIKGKTAPTYRVIVPPKSLVAAA